MTLLIRLGGARDVRLRFCVSFQDAANMHPSLQHAVLSVLQASLSSTQGGPSAAHATAEQLTSLLQLLQLGHSSSAITKLAYEVAQSYLQQAVGFDNLAEVHLWLDSLPAASTNGQPARCELQSTPECQGAARPEHALT